MNYMRSNYPTFDLIIHVVISLARASKIVSEVFSYLCLEVVLLGQNARINPTPQPEHPVCVPRVKRLKFANDQSDNALNL